mmetsp:Transcript_17843/g.58671  ORF Transcript_17843/g.58671 Transcript_17843/m.58671 type:complete len:846 (-) Transcript_17843:74-2611(-)
MKAKNAPAINSERERKTSEVTDIDETSSSEEEDSRLMWAKSNGFSKSLQEFYSVIKLMEGREIKAKDVIEGREIARGAFGSIYSGTMHGLPVAVKHICKGPARGEISFRQIFHSIRLELAVTRVLNHPNIVEFKGMITNFPDAKGSNDDFQLAFVFELCSNGSLFDLIHRKTVNLPLLKKFSIAREIASGVGYLHDLSIVHRDLSTNNVLLTSDMQVKITDFGCSRQIFGEVYQSTTISGSPAYMAPEQLQGQDLTLKVDVWAMGVIMWELVNEVIPWKDKDFNNRKEMAELVAVKGTRLPRTPENRLPPGFSKPYHALLDSMFQASVPERISIKAVHERIKEIETLDVRTAESWTESREKLSSRLRCFYAKYNASKMSNVRDVVRDFHGNESDLNERLRKSYNADLNDLESPQQDIKESFDSSEQSRSSTMVDDKEVESGTSDYFFTPQGLEAKLIKFYEIINPSRMSEAASLAKRYFEDISMLNHSLTQKYGVSLNASEEELRSRKCFMSLQEENETSSTCSNDSLPHRINALKDMLVEFYSNVNPSKLKDAERVAKSNVDTVEKLNESLRKKYGKDLNSNKEDSNKSSSSVLIDRLTQFYNFYKPSNVHQVEAVLTKYQYDTSKLNETLRAKYGADLESFLLKDSKHEEDLDISSPMESKNHFFEHDQGQKTCSLNHLKFWKSLGPVPDHQVSDSAGKRSVSQKEAADVSCQPENENGKQDCVEMDERDLVQKLKFFYSFWNPAKADKAKQVASSYKFMVSDLNRSLQDKYGLDLDSPSDQIMTRGKLALRLYRLYEKLPAGKKESQIKSIPKLVSSYYGREAELATVLRQQGFDVQATSLR